MPGCFYEPHFGAFLDEAEKFRREGHEIHMLVCNGAFDICTTNVSKNLDACSFCAKYTNKLINKVSRDIRIHRIKKYFDNSVKYRNFIYNSVDDIKQIKYKGVKIGFACLSTYISKTRNLNPIINSKSRSDFDYLLLQSRILTDAIGNALDDIRPALVYVFNGRFFDSRPVLDIARQKKIDIKCMDVDQYANKIFVKQISYNATLQNIKGDMSRLNHAWNSPTVSHGDKIKIAHDFFQKKRAGIYIDDTVYIKNQEKGLLPSDFDKGKQNIVIFNSSADEFAAVDDEYSKLCIFKSPIDGMEYIFRTFKNNKKIHFYLRIHPNLSGIKYKYHTDLYLFQKKYSNVTVIPPGDKVSSYDLLDAAEKIIVFGSTMGVEATYWNKAVILLSGCRYYYLDACYKPKNQLELKKMIVSKLKPKEKNDALKYGYYLMYKDPEALYKYIDFTQYNFNFLGKRMGAMNYKKILGSSKLFAIHLGFMERLYNHANIHRVKF
jgi:hypothetical protein